jgi:hypothetical protein
MHREVREMRERERKKGWECGRTEVNRIFRINHSYSFSCGESQFWTGFPQKVACFSERKNGTMTSSEERGQNDEHKEREQKAVRDERKQQRQSAKLRCTKRDGSG